jgi:hypothetical protein
MPHDLNSKSSLWLSFALGLVEIRYSYPSRNIGEPLEWLSTNLHVLHPLQVPFRRKRIKVSGSFILIPASTHDGEREFDEPILAITNYLACLYSRLLVTRTTRKENRAFRV